MFEDGQEGNLDLYLTLFVGGIKINFHCLGEVKIYQFVSGVCCLNDIVEAEDPRQVLHFMKFACFLLSMSFQNMLLHLILEIKSHPDEDQAWSHEVWREKWAHHRWTQLALLVSTDGRLSLQESVIFFSKDWEIEEQNQIE